MGSTVGWKGLGMRAVCIVLLAFAGTATGAEPALYTWQPHETRWYTPENPQGVAGGAARTNRGAKGDAFVPLPADGRLVLADIDGSGVIRRIWLTINRRTPAVLRGLRLRMTWDGAATPAVDVPFGDFFGAGNGQLVAFENALFSSPEGRSFNTLVPMPFRRHARIELINESGVDLRAVYYEIDAELGVQHDDDMLHFHATWRRERATAVGTAFEVLPRIAGRGRFLGMQVSVITAPGYFDTAWQEGEVKVYLDEDRDWPTLAGTGTEDYIGTGWGQGIYSHAFQGATQAGTPPRQWAFYRLHVPDPVWFRSGARVTLQQMGGGYRDTVAALQASGVAMQAVSVTGAPFVRLLDEPAVKPLSAYGTERSWANYYRSDDVAAVAWFYLDRAGSPLPPLAPAAERMAELEER